MSMSLADDFPYGEKTTIEKLNGSAAPCQVIAKAKTHQGKPMRGSVKATLNSRWTPRARTCVTPPPVRVHRRAWAEGGPDRLSGPSSLADWRFSSPLTRRRY